MASYKKKTHIGTESSRVTVGAAGTEDLKLVLFFRWCSDAKHADQVMLTFHGRLITPYLFSLILVNIQ